VRPLLPHPGRVQLEVGDGTTQGVVEESPRVLQAKLPARGPRVGDALADALGGPLHRRFAQPDAGHFLQQLGPLLEAVGDRAGQGRQPFHGRCQVCVGQADGLVKRAAAVAARPAQVIGPQAAHRATDAQGVALPVAVESGGLAALGAVDARAMVAVFF